MLFSTFPYKVLIERGFHKLQGTIWFKVRFLIDYMQSWRTETILRTIHGNQLLWNDNSSETKRNRDYINA